MKKTTFTLLLSFACCWLAAQCPTGDIIFSTQGQIDSFQINYPGCERITGKVTISGADISSLQSLSTIDSIKGSLRIVNNPVLVSLGGLGNLHYVGESLIQILGSKATEGLTIAGNTALNSLAGLDNLRSVKACVSIGGNPSLTTLDGLDSLSSLGAGHGGAGSESWATYSLSISGNKGLKTIGKFGNLDSLYILQITENDSLLSLKGLESIRSVGELYVGYNALLPNFKGLDNLQSAGRLYIEGNYSLQNFEGLENLGTIQCHSNSFQEGWISLHVEGNSLVSFSGLENVQSIGCAYSTVKIIGNWHLQSLSGISGAIDSLVEVVIQDNPSLSICEVQPVCDFLSNGGPATITDNAPGCNSVAEVEAACIVSIEETSGGEPVIVFSPNPAVVFLQIQIEDSEIWDISLFDLQGRLMYRQSVSGSRIIEIEDWPAGVYALRAVSGGRAYTGRFVKE